MSIQKHPLRSIAGLSVAMATVGLLMVGGSVVGVGLAQSQAVGDPSESSAQAGQKWEKTLSWAQGPEEAPAITHNPEVSNPFDDGAIASSGAAESQGLQVSVGIDGVPEVPADIKSRFGVFLNRASSFNGGNVVYPNTDMVMARAIAAIGNAQNVCTDGQCYNLCDHVAGDLWGYEVASGYATARLHWETMVAKGIAKKGDRTPPLGALLFWDSGEFGHVATYIGNGKVVSNFVLNGEKNIFVVDADWYESVGTGYLGWADPIFFGQNPGEAL